MFEIFRGYPNLIVVISGKKDGTMKLTGDSLCDKKVIEGRKRFLEKSEINSNLIVVADLVQGNNLEIVSNREAGKVIEKTDGLITADKNLFLTITVADCLPIFLYDPKREVVALVHAGWRNLAGNILREAIEKIKTNNLLVGIGPGIGQCHFEVKQDVIAKFKSYLKDALIKRDDKTFLDLKKIAKIQLIDLGIKEENIEINPDCTFCLKDKYFSFRRDKPKQAQTMLAVIGRK